MMSYLRYQPMNDQTLIATIVGAAQERRADDIQVLDLHEVSSTLDYFVICTGTAGLQINAIVQHIKEKTAEMGTKVGGIEGPSERWMLLQYGTTIVHVMTKEAREYYDLEGLWNDAKRVSI